MHLRTRLVCSEIVRDLFLQDFLKLYVLKIVQNCRGKYKGDRKTEISVFFKIRARVAKIVAVFHGFSKTVYLLRQQK